MNLEYTDIPIVKVLRTEFQFEQRFLVLLMKEINNNLIRLPSFPNADRKILDQYIEAFKKVIQHADKIR